jgi:hypothetical protein
MYNIYIYLELLGTVSPHKILGEKQWPHGHCRFWHCLQITSQKWLQSTKHWICQENVVVTELCPLSLQCKGGSNHTDMGLQRALSERKDRRPFFSHPHQLSRMACYFKPHAPWDHGEPTRIRTDMWNISLSAPSRSSVMLAAAQGHSDGAQWFLVIDIWLRGSRRISKVVFLVSQLRETNVSAPNINSCAHHCSMSIFTIDCLAPPLFHVVWHGTRTRTSCQLHSHLQKHDSGSEIWLNDIG